MPLRISEKWGFGMAPPKPSTQRARHASCLVIDVLLSSVGMPASSDELLNAISDVKGLFNRVARQDQWDWFTVCGQLGYPSLKLSQSIGGHLSSLRLAIRNQDKPSFDKTIALLNELPVRLCLACFVGKLRIREEADAGWIYLLSIRQSKTVLKIGMTTRTVEQRVNEINSATGVVVPFGVRRCWRVRNPGQVEKLVHDALSEFRIRDDREFFEAEFTQIVTIIQRTIVDSGFEIRTLNALIESAR